MSNVLTFTPRPKLAAPEALKPLAGSDLRASLEEAAQTALDAADRIIAVLDRMDGDADHEDGGDDEPSLAAPENHTGSQVVYMRGNDQDHEGDAPEIALPEVPAGQPAATVIEVPAGQPAATVIEVPPMRWGGRGNVLAAAGSALLDLLERA